MESLSLLFCPLTLQHRFIWHAHFLVVLFLQPSVDLRASEQRYGSSELLHHVDHGQTRRFRDVLTDVRSRLGSTYVLSSTLSAFYFEIEGKLVHSNDDASDILSKDHLKEIIIKLHIFNFRTIPWTLWLVLDPEDGAVVLLWQSCKLPWFHLG